MVAWKVDTVSRFSAFGRGVFEVASNRFVGYPERRAALFGDGPTSRCFVVD